MGINAGGRRSDGSGKRKPRRFPRGQVKKPIQPTEENPFPSDPEFRFGVFKVEEIKDDYLVCKGFNPRAKFPFTEFTPAAFAKVEIAKPPLLQRTPWDGETIEIDGTEYTYNYTDDNTRTKSWTDEDENDQEVEENIDIPYFVDDILVAVEVRKNQVVDGMKVNETKVKNSNGALLSWVDINVSARKWEGPGSCESQNAIMQITMLGSPTGGSFFWLLVIDDEQANLEFEYNDGSSQVENALALHPLITPADVEVTGGPFPNRTMQIEFKGAQGDKNIAIPLSNFGGLTGGTGTGVITSLTQLGIE